MERETRLIISRIKKLKTNSNSARSYLNKAIENILEAVEEDKAYKRIY